MPAAHFGQLKELISALWGVLGAATRAEVRRGRCPYRVRHSAPEGRRSVARVVRPWTETRPAVRAPEWRKWRDVPRASFAPPGLLLLSCRRSPGPRGPGY